jgi:hypothetical protein
MLKANLARGSEVRTDKVVACRTCLFRWGMHSHVRDFDMVDCLHPS